MSQLVTLNEEHRHLLDAVYGVLLKEGRWPPYQYLERIFYLQFDLDLGEICKTIPDWLTTLPRAPYPASPEQLVAVTIAGLQHCPAAGADVALFFRIFRQFVELEKTLVPTSLDAIPMPCLATDELAGQWGLEESTVKRAFEIA